MDPFQILEPSERWAPTRQEAALFDNEYSKLLPPLVQEVRNAVFNWRERNYEGATDTTKSLLNYWFYTNHGTQVSYFFPQQEAIESVIYLFEIAQAHDKYNLMRFDSSGQISTGMFPESWARYFIKMATGSGKTKVMALAIAWAYFNRLYENDSPLTNNFLFIAPNIIVLNRLLKDFDDLRIFREDPILPEDGYDDKNWVQDFQLTLHVQDEVKPISEDGNLFLTNIHRVFLYEDQEPALEEHFLGKKPKPTADTEAGMDLGRILRSDRIQELMVLNDEAHHIHDEKLAWFQNIQDLHNQLKLKYDKGLTLQLDCSATPRQQDGSIFPQVISDYPLVEAIKQKVVKSPVLPDKESRQQLEEKQSSDFIERYQEYIDLGFKEWQQQYKEMGKYKSPILFLMTNNTKEADEAANYLESHFPEMKDAVLTIHTNKSGDIRGEGAANKKAREELEKLREAADVIDREDSPYRAIVSVLMLREGWDVRNVTTIVGLRPYGAKSQILPEQTLGRGLRKMFSLEDAEKLVVIGTNAFIEFVEQLETEGVEFEYRSFDINKRSKNTLIIQIDEDSTDKELEALDIELPVLSHRVYKEYTDLSRLDIDAINIQPHPFKRYPEEKVKEIVFRNIEGEESHTTSFEASRPDYRNILRFFTDQILQKASLFSGFDIIYPKLIQFIEEKLFDQKVAITDPQTMRNLAEVDVQETLYKTFANAIDELTIKDKGDASVKAYFKLSDARPVVEDEQANYIPDQSIFNRVVGDGRFELEIASFLDQCPDIISFAKNHRGVNFYVEYQAANGAISNYHPDFLVKKYDNEVYIIETKGMQNEDTKRKWERLKVWCEDVSNAGDTAVNVTPLYIPQSKWNDVGGKAKSFDDVVQLFQGEEPK